MRQKSRLGLLDRLGSWLATSKHIDGLWVGVSPAYEVVNNDSVETGLCRVEEALCLIKTYDRLRYDRLTRDLERIWVRIVEHYAGLFTPSLKLCELDCRFVAKRSPDVIASMIVHEATHARLRRCGIGYEENIRARVEAVCIRRELAFSAKLPNGETVRELAEINLESYAVPEILTDAARDRLRAEGLVQTFRELGTPEWRINLILCIRRTLHSIRTAYQSISNSVRRFIKD